MSDTLITVEEVAKKFCRRLKRSLWYGMKDMAAELIGRNNNHRNLRKEEFWAVKDVSFQLKRGDTLGVIGRNGAGKTTLLRMLNGLIKLDAGRIEVRGRMQALIALGAGFNPVLTGRENIYVNASVLGIPKAEVDLRLDEIVDFSGIEEFIDTPVRSYSSGMVVRLGFAVAAHMKPDILIVDEVLAVGDEGFQVKCLNKIGELKKNGAAIILVSHNMHTVSTFSNRIILLNNGRHKEFGSVAKGINAYKSLFFDQKQWDIEKFCSGSGKVIFYDADITERELAPGDSFSISIKYRSEIEYRDIEVDIGLNSSNEPSRHFQATNKAYGKIINLNKGQGEILIQIHDIKINNAMGKVAIGIWTKNRTEQLFWWRIPVKFKGMDFATGSNFLNVSYDVI